MTNQEEMQNTIIALEDSTVVVRDHEGNEIKLPREGDDIWASAETWGELLEYKDPANSINRIYTRHKKEFTNDITRSVKLTERGKPPVTVREFNLEGFAALCQHSEQPKAVEVRKWARKLMKEMWVHGVAIEPQVLQLTPEEFDQKVEAAIVRAAEKDLIRPLSDVEIIQRMYHNDIALYADKMIHATQVMGPEVAEKKFWFLNDQLQETLVDWRSYVEGPRIGVTRITDDWFAQLWLDKKYSPDYVREVFPLDFKYLKDVEARRKKLGLPPYRPGEINNELSKKIFSLKYQFGIDGGYLVRQFPNFTLTALLNAFQAKSSEIMRIFADPANQQKGVERNKPSYDDYIASDIWKIIKREALVYPDGPLDRCWDCKRPLSISTADLHHLTYRRLGVELYPDVIPLCRSCHIYRHPEKNGLPADAENPNMVMAIPNVKLTGWYKPNQASYACIINGTVNTYVVKDFITADSQVQKPEDEGLLLVRKHEKYTNNLAQFAVK